MHRSRHACRFAGHLVLATLCIVLTALPSAQSPIRPFPEALAAAPAELVERLRADPFTYFRFINRAWTARVCEAFADVRNPTIASLHGDAHVEQYAFTDYAWGLEDFDDSARGPVFVDIVRFLGSIDLATRQRGWTRDRDALWDRFFEGYRRGLSEPDAQPREPGVVRRLRQLPSYTRIAFLEWGEKQMQPMEEPRLKLVATAMESLDRLVRRERTDLATGYFAVISAGWLRLGVGSATAKKVLIRVQGPTAVPDDDVLLEAKEVANLDGLACLEGSTVAQAARVIDGTRQLGRVKHDILAIGPTLLIPAAADRAEHGLDWWIHSWEPSYREVHLTDLLSADDLAEIAYDSGVQLGVGKPTSVKKQALSAVGVLETRLRKETSRLVEELLAGWRELAAR